MSTTLHTANSRRQVNIPGVEERDLDRFQKIVSMYQSDNRHEQDAAFNRAKAFCGSKGWSYKEAMGYLAQLAQAAEPMNFFAGMEFSFEGSDPGSIIRKCRESAEADRLLLERYGDFEAVLALNEQEQLLVNAVSQANIDWSRPHDAIYPTEVLEAVGHAYDLPSTIPEALEEISFWKQRNADRRRAYSKKGSDSWNADLYEVEARWSFIDNLLFETMVPRSIDELFALIDYADDCSLNGQGLILKVKKWIGHMVASGTFRPEPNGSESAKPDTREHIRQIKTNPGTADWSLAQIATKLGVSRTTVWKHIQKLQRDGLL